MDMGIKPRDAMPVLRELRHFDRRSGNALERLVFNHRAAMIVLCTLVTLLLGYLAATRLSPNASFERMLPQGQPYSVLLTFMFTLNMVGALVLVPALSHFLLRKVR